MEEARLSIASLSLSSVTAQVGKQIGAFSGMDISKAARRSPQNGEDKWKEPVQHQSLLHKKLYEKNAVIQINTKSFFEVCKQNHNFRKNISNPFSEPLF